MDIAGEKSGENCERESGVKMLPLRNGSSWDFPAWSGLTPNCLLKALPTMKAFPLVCGMSVWSLCEDASACGLKRLLQVTGKLKLTSISREGLKRAQSFL